MSFTIYHNPRCSKSRQTLEILQEAGVELTTVLYLEQPLDQQQILDLARALGEPVAAITRQKEPEFLAADARPDINDDRALAAFIAAHPKVLERPVVVDDASGKAVIGRPPENVRALLD